MKKYNLIFVIMSLVLCLAVTGCNSNAENTVEKGNNKSIDVVCTIFPEYDWVRELTKNVDADYNLTLLLDGAVDMHSFQPSAEDIAKISDCDLFIYVGGESDAWVDSALENAENPNMKAINLLDTLGTNVKEEEIVEGMEAEVEEDEEHEEHEEEIEYDEHVWLSLNNAKVLNSVISSELSEIDPDNADAYNENYVSYAEKLDSLNLQYAEAVEKGSKNTVLFGDRFPFRYLVDDYGLNYYAAFVGCSAETEASFDTIVFLASKVDNLGLNSVLTIENSDHKIAETIISNTTNKNQEILTLNSLQSVTKQNIDDGMTYISAMTDNLSVLKQALN